MGPKAGPILPQAAESYAFKKASEQRTIGQKNKVHEISEKITEQEAVEIDVLNHLRNTVKKHNKLIEMAKRGTISNYCYQGSKAIH